MQISSFFSSFSSLKLDNNIKMDELHNVFFLAAHNQGTACGDKREATEKKERAAIL